MSQLPITASTYKGALVQRHSPRKDERCSWQSAKLLIVSHNIRKGLKKTFQTSPPYLSSVLLLQAYGSWCKWQLQGHTSTRSYGLPLYSRTFLIWDKYEFFWSKSTTSSPSPNSNSSWMTFLCLSSSVLAACVCFRAPLQRDPWPSIQFHHPSPTRDTLWHKLFQSFQRFRYSPRLKSVMRILRCSGSSTIAHQILFIPTPKLIYFTYYI